ncbi:hypothetical protein BpHYR1_015535 [Brachionus plicatilis]|uniref:Uncharacterized protein n=1 Tax=Brachionus plicatilis TaxID=10195 RepID=A0A3M7PJW4_BRAPC|nr:hypothetical protein BpHYR1_015535 [Brachionus plicatilis]
MFDKKTTLFIGKFREGSPENKNRIHLFFRLYLNMIATNLNARNLKYLQNVSTRHQQNILPSN